jgi:hypothetical protein
MALVNQNGSLVVRGGALGTGQACCCGGSCCALITETRCCFTLPGEGGFPTSSDGYYITDAERIANEEQCEALNGTLRIIGQRYKCLRITTDTPNWVGNAPLFEGTATAEQCAASQPCSDTCPPPYVPDCPLATGREFPLIFFPSDWPFVLGGVTFEEALAVVAEWNDENSALHQLYAESACPPPYTIRAFGPYQTGLNCAEGGRAYGYQARCLDCVGAVGVCDENCDYLGYEADPSQPFPPGTQRCDECNPLP